ncbi:fibrobacter succinogenes major paralogous domain-containing protein [Fibrobacter sp.]|uniref:fibrobacter succinogenes major paralogous domain-containing protein n=1 Tax=Fibrobacter sp. TaxID=35828 RepID=UPI00386EC026
MKSNLFVSAFVGMSVLFAACSSDDEERVSGGVTEDAGFVADVAGVAQKGPFVKGSAVTVRGIDCKTLEFTDQVFEGAIKSDKGDFALDSVALDTSCAVVEVTGRYLNEVTGKKTKGELTLRALTDLKDRENVNVNLLTNLAYERMMYLVKEKSKTLAKAKVQAEKEVLAAFDIKDEVDEFENLNIFESGDGNAALLAVSVIMQGDADETALAKRLDNFDDSFAESGEWKDSETKKAIAEWVAEASANGKLDSIRKNIEGLGYGDSIPAFEKYIPVVTSADGDSVILSEVEGSSSSDVIGSETKQSSSSVSPADSVNSSSSSSSVKADAGSRYDAAANTLKDLRDGRTYRTTKIGGQVWMAENLNYETPNSYCYNDSASYCDKYGHLYAWKDALNACPTGWHLPSVEEFVSLIELVGERWEAGGKLKSTTGWDGGHNGTDDYSFTALPAGFKNESGVFQFEGREGFFWTSSDESTSYAYGIHVDTNEYAATFLDHKSISKSIRCMMDVEPSSSSSVASVNSSSSIEVARVCNRRGSDDCEYGTLTDDRDGQTYKTVKIGKQWWMAENLNYASLQPSDSLDSTSFCYNDSLKYCAKYGRLYFWSAAMDSAATWSENGKGCGYGVVCTPTFPVRGVCPAGWHIPNRDELYELVLAVGGVNDAGDALNASSTLYEQNPYGFSFLPSGRKRIPVAYMDIGEYIYDDDGEYGYIWSSTDDYWNSEELFIRDHLEYELVVALSVSKGGEVGLHGYEKKSGYPVRCIKD